MIEDKILDICLHKKFFKQFPTLFFMHEKIDREIYFEFDKMDESVSYVSRKFTRQEVVKIRNFLDELLEENI